MRANLDRSRCQGHAQCVLTAPDLFDLDDKDGRARVLTDPVPDRLAESATQAAGRCPEQAISLTS